MKGLEDAKGVHFTESVSIREKERKDREEHVNRHRRKNASEAVRVERLFCEFFLCWEEWEGVKSCEEWGVRWGCMG